MARLRRKGAPVSRSEYENYNCRDKIMNEADILDEIEDAAREYPTELINELVQTMCYCRGITTIEGVAETAAAKRFVIKARSAARRARRDVLPRADGQRNVAKRTGGDE
jgi:hypothetical protein